MVCGQVGDFVGNFVRVARMVVTAKKFRDDAEGAFHAAAKRSPDHRDGRKQRVGIAGGFTDPCGVITTVVPQIAARHWHFLDAGKDRQVSWVDELERQARPVGAGQLGKRTIVRKSVDNGAEWSAAFTTDNQVDFRQVEIVWGNRGVVTAYYEEGLGKRAVGEPGKVLDHGGLVSVAGDADEVRLEPAEYLFECAGWGGFEAEVEHTRLVIWPGGGSKVTELDRFQPLKPLKG